jgi:hypothetical protein
MTAATRPPDGVLTATRRHRRNAAMSYLCTSQIWQTDAAEGAYCGQTAREENRMADEGPRWVARLTPEPDRSVDDLLALPLGLDVWERHAGSLLVAADEAQLAEVERRRLARVERIETVAAFVERAQRQAQQ